MPLYEYHCRRCGSFHDWRPISQAERPAPCPACGKLGRRAVAAPRLGMAAGLRNLHARNEKSANEPAVVRREVGDHGHAHGHDQGHGKPARRGGRPWMIGH
jgi:putative FmdB family regulatory protein